MMRALAPVAVVLACGCSEAPVAPAAPFAPAPPPPAAFYPPDPIFVQGGPVLTRPPWEWILPTNPLVLDVVTTSTAPKPPPVPTEVWSKNWSTPHTPAASMTVSEPLGALGELTQHARDWQPGFLVCIDAACARDPKLIGGAHFTIDVGATGEITSIHGTPSGWFPETLVDCLETRVALDRFGPPPAGATQIRLQVNVWQSFSAPNAAGAPNAPGDSTAVQKKAPKS